MHGHINLIMVFVDFNAVLANFETLPKNWYRSQPFNKNRFLLNEFVCGNELSAVIFDFKQGVNYTYFKGNMQSSRIYSTITN